MGSLVLLLLLLLMMVAICAPQRAALDNHTFRMMMCLAVENAYVESYTYGAGYITGVKKVPYLYKRGLFRRTQTVQTTVAFRVKYHSGIELSYSPKSVKDLHDFSKIGPVTREIFTSTHFMDKAFRKGWIATLTNNIEEIEQWNS